MEDACGAGEGGDAVPTLYADLHRKFILAQDGAKDTFEYWATEHLRLSGVYWGLTAMHVLGYEEDLKKEEVVAFVLSCRDDATGAFGGNVDHDPHLLYTLSAVQVLALYDALDRIDVDKVVAYVTARQQEDGSFAGDEWGEVDSRFSYIAISCLSLLGRLDAIDVDRAVDWILACKNFDGAFGCVPQAESHAGQTFCCVGALAIAGALDRVDADLLGWWLAERQVPVGGLNGRPEKKPDVCYSWWVLSALSILHRLQWINQPALSAFILRCQDDVGGGIADRPEDQSDLFHTFFGVAGLALLGEPQLHAIDPAYALPVTTLQRMGIALPWATV